MSWLPRGSSGEKEMGMDNGQSTLPHQGDGHVMTRRMWVLGQPLRCPESELLLCAPAGRRESCRVTPQWQEGVLSVVNWGVDQEMGGEGLTSPQVRHCRPVILTLFHFFSATQFCQSLFGVCFPGHQADWRAADASLSLVMGQRSDAPHMFDIHGSWRAVVGQSRRERPYRFCPGHGWQNYVLEGNRI